MLTIPKDKQRKWKEEHGGVQNPIDDELALDFGKEKAHITKNEFAVGEDGEFEIDKDKNVYFRLDGRKSTSLMANDTSTRSVKTPQVVSGQGEAAGLPRQRGSRSQR